MQKCEPDRQEFAEASTADRIKFAAVITSFVGVLELSRMYLLPKLLSHIKTLPECEQLTWLVTTIKATFWSAPILVSLCVLPIATKMLKQKQFPPTSAWIVKRTKILKGQAVVKRAKLLIILCALTFLAPLWASHTIEKSKFFNLCTGKMAPT